MMDQEDVSVLAELSLASLANARRLIDDALLLADSQRWTTAHVVGVFASEEYGKHVLVSSFPFSRDGSEVEVERLNKRIRSHEEKARAALFSGWLVDPYDLREWPDDNNAHRVRMRLLYTEYSFDDGVSSPDEFADAAATRSFIDVVERHISVSERLFGRLTVEGLAARMSEALSQGPGSGLVDPDSVLIPQLLRMLAPYFGISQDLAEQVIHLLDDDDLCEFRDWTEAPESRLR